MEEETRTVPGRYDITPSARALHAQQQPADEAAAEDERAKEPPVPLGHFEHDVGQLVAGLIDGELERRRPLGDIRWFCRAMRMPDVRILRVGVHELEFRVIAWRIQQVLNQHEPTAVAGGEGEDDPRFASIDLPGGAAEVPYSLRAAFASGTLLDDPCGVILQQRLGSDGYWVGFVAPEGKRPVINRLEELLRQGELGHPYHGLVLEAVKTDAAPGLRVVPPPTDRRGELILPDNIWEEVDHNVANLFENAELLSSLGLGLNRGLLLTGPPGTGKTHLTRVLAAELAGRASVIFVDPKLMTKDLARVYRIAQDLAPALVVLEDVDLAVARRDGGASESLNEFLVAVDGAMTEHNGIVTIATTNAVHAIDDAAKRAARFDRIIEVPLPPPLGRRRIWKRYLSGLNGDFDLEALVQATRGGSGADIREIVRHAILVTNGSVTTEVLLQGTKDRGLGGRVTVGHYL